jgi:hypothetical protein
MSYKLSKAQFNKVIEFPGPQRYAYFITKVTDWQEVWTLKSPEGIVTLGDEEGKVCVPLWPHPDYASALARDAWFDCQPENVDIETFMEKWVKGMVQAGYLFAVFPISDQQGVVASPERLHGDLTKGIEGNKKKRPV